MAKKRKAKAAKRKLKPAKKSLRQLHIERDRIIIAGLTPTSMGLLPTVNWR